MEMEMERGRRRRAPEAPAIGDTGEAALAEPAVARWRMQMQAANNPPESRLQMETHSAH
jgi:hypothetical protein